MRATLVLAFTLAVSGCADAPSSFSPLGPSGTSVPLSSGNRITAHSRIDPSLGHGGVEVSTTLTGAAEVPGPGDPDGSGTARITLNVGQGEVCVDLQVSNIVPATAAHIHIGGPTVAGDVVVTLPPPTTGTATDCVSADRELLQEIVRNPLGYYVNVHNADFPGGAIRGQLTR